MSATRRCLALAIVCLFMLIATSSADNELEEDIKDTTRQGRDYYSSYYGEEEKNKFAGYPESYPPSNYITYKEEAPANCPPSPLIPVLNSGLNFLALKLGALGIIKTVLAVIFFVFLFKLPILLAKAAFFKAILFPALLAPIMMLFSGTMGNNMMNAMMPDKPSDSGNNNNNNNNNNNDGTGREMDDAVTGAAWRSIKLLMDSERCAERMACQFGVFNNDSMSGATLGRMAKYIEHSSPVSTRLRIRSLREAFNEGNTAGSCPYESYPCQAPHLVLSQGESSFRVL